MENPSNENAELVDQHDHDDEAINLFNEINSDSDDSNDDEVNELDQEQDDDGASDDVPQAKEPASSADDDPWASAPESLRNDHLKLKQQYQQLESNHRANSGRVSALTKKLNEVQKGLSDNEKANGANANTSNGMPSADDLKGKSFAEVEEEWPEIAEYIREKVQKASSDFDAKLTPLRELEQQKAQAEERDFINSQFQRLEQAHPDYLQIAQSPQLAQWLRKQPGSVQEMARSDLADDNIALLTLFKAQHPGASVQKAKSKNSLSDYAEIPRKGAGKASADPDDVDPIAYFNQLNSK